MDKKRYQYKIITGHKADGSIIRKSFYSYKSNKDAKRKAESWLIEHKAKDLSCFDNS